MEIFTESSSPCSQQPAIRPYPEPDASSPHLHNIFPNDQCYYHLPIYTHVFRVVSSTTLHYKDVYKSTNKVVVVYFF